MWLPYQCTVPLTKLYTSMLNNAVEIMHTSFQLNLYKLLQPHSNISYIATVVSSKCIVFVWSTLSFYARSFITTSLTITEPNQNGSIMYSCIYMYTYVYITLNWLHCFKYKRYCYITRTCEWFYTSSIVYD